MSYVNGLDVAYFRQNIGAGYSFGRRLYEARQKESFGAVNTNLSANFSLSLGGTIFPIITSMHTIFLSTSSTLSRNRCDEKKESTTLIFSHLQLSNGLYQVLLDC